MRRDARCRGNPSASRCARRENAPRDGVCKNHVNDVTNFFGREGQIFLA